METGDVDNKAAALGEDENVETEDAVVNINEAGVLESDADAAKTDEAVPDTDTSDDDAGNEVDATVLGDAADAGGAEIENTVALEAAPLGGKNAGAVGPDVEVTAPMLEFDMDIGCKVDVLPAVIAWVIDEYVGTVVVVCTVVDPSASATSRLDCLR
ncbi:hypothetical protein OBBRIDRAFT_802268 [Obba rivulosa]|uniref:Uncharacterized protein n=1 Tax=Obba rivulosa TaxID=1052685 RepID=A0A8E2B3C6_9APHY|nr:hypothetical protein OBBRIDRAFT_802268 [Obba rivulosa]